MPFRFKMQKILEYRQQQEEQAKVRLAQAQQAYAKEEERVLAIKAELEAKENELYGRVVDNSGERWLLENFIKGLRSDVESGQMRLRTLSQMVEEARKFLQQKALEHKVLDKLRERQNAQYLLEEREKELKVNDETATIRCKTATF